MNAKIKFYKRMMIGLSLILASTGYAFELEPGTYEIIGRFDPKTRILTVYEDTSSEMPLYLYGTQTLTGFLQGNQNHYRVKVKIYKKIPDQGGKAELLEVINLVPYNPAELQFRKL